MSRSCNFQDGVECATRLRSTETRTALCELTPSVGSSVLVLKELAGKMGFCMLETMEIPETRQNTSRTYVRLQKLRNSRMDELQHPRRLRRQGSCSEGQQGEQTLSKD